MAKYAIIPELSRIWADARSSLHPIHVETDGVEGELSADVVDGAVYLELPTHIELEVERLQSHNALIDMDLRRRLDTRKFRCIEGDLDDAAPLGGFRLRLTGRLKIHGVSQTVVVDVTAKATGDSVVEVEGEKVIDMRDFGLTPPRFLTLRVEPTVRIRARLVASRAREEGQRKS